MLKFYFFTIKTSSNPIWFCSETTVQQKVESSAAAKVFCECGEGWSCVVSKTEGPEAGKTYFECGEGCICVIDETNNVKVACA